ncbi:MAG: hypothetical protein K9M99_04830 [Candidatus Cloacimonetes bacterium]|nr:hypothetical protein [Candidatus Cloacimonadota bacterium]
MQGIRRIVLLSVIVILIIMGCDISKGNDIKGLIDKGEFAKARKLLNAKLADNAQDSESNVLLALSFRKEYYPTWDVRKYRSPLEAEWNLFPVNAMTEFRQYQEILEKLGKKGVWNADIEREYYFLLTYEFYRMKYQDDSAAAADLPKIINIVRNGAGELADNAEFWNIYAENNYCIDLDLNKLNSLLLKYPETELAGLKVLQQVFTGKAGVSGNIELQIDRLGEFKAKYPEFSLYADSIFIYRSLDTHIKEYNEAALNQLLARNISVTVNRHILLMLSRLAIREGDVDSGLAAMSKIVNQEQDKYERDKLNLELGKLAYKNKRFGVAISSLRQIEDLSLSSKKQLWESYLEMDNELEANAVFNELKGSLSNADLKKMNLRKFEYDLSKLELSELNLVQGNGSVTIEGVISNPTRKIYKNISIQLTLSGKKGTNRIDKTVIIGELYPGTKEKFNEFIDYKTDGAEIKYTGKVIGFEVVSS